MTDSMESVQEKCNFNISSVQIEWNLYFAVIAHGNWISLGISTVYLTFSCVV